MSLLSLSQMGFNAFFQQQLSLEQLESYTLARISAQHRAHIELMTELHTNLKMSVTSLMVDLTVGDWILINQQGLFEQRLDRQSLFARKSAGSKVDLQLIAANINTVFIVCSLDDNFNLNRIERYLALAYEANVEPVVVLTKADCCHEVDKYRGQVQSLDPMLMVEAVNALDTSSIEPLKAWCATGKTVAFIGSSGVGKSTLVNTLLDDNSQLTAASREDDNRGRHTTTSRSLHLMPTGGLLLDTPGMRELQLVDCEQGISDTFSEITALANQCRFANCQHHSEPGCAVNVAIEEGDLESRRLDNYEKLLKEQARNSATLAQKRSKDKNLGRFYKSVIKESKQRKNK
ncbi:MAG: ribosome small subunit-dependent GTPase A [Colwellia sp.]|nr:ribosome small subunit-dependent GTPase A [Colwellia sp.]